MKAGISLLVMGLLLAPPARAGTLDDFEAAATRPATASDAGEHTAPDRHAHCDDAAERALNPLCGIAESLGGFLIRMVALPFVLGGEGSLALERGREDERAPVPPRAPGDLALPRAALEVDYLAARDDIQGIDLRAEAGYAFLGADLRYQRLTEQQPPDRLEITRAHLLFRGRYGPMQLNLGLGRIDLGDSSGDSRLLALQLPLGRALALRGSVITGHINDNDIELFEGTVLARSGLAGLHAGYRLQRSGGVEIEGPFAGVALRY